MSSSVHRTPKSTNKQSLFFNDLTTPVTNRRSGSGKFTTPGQTAAVSALWRENFATSDQPPPPIFTLEDQSDFPPESGIQDYPIGSPEPTSNPRTPSNKLFSASPGKSPQTNSNSSTSTLYGIQQKSVQNPPGNSSWWSAAAAGDDKEKGPGSSSPVDGVVHRQPAALYTLTPPREVARPEIQRNSVPVFLIDEEEWVTIYGFSPAYEFGSSGV